MINRPDRCAPKNGEEFTAFHRPQRANDKSIIPFESALIKGPSDVRSSPESGKGDKQQYKGQFPLSPESGHVQCRSAHVSYGASAEISRSTRRVRFTSLRVVPNFFYRSLNFFCRLVETFAPALRQGSRGNGNPISLRLWPVPRDHGSAPIGLRTSHTNQFNFPTAPPGRRKLPSCPLCPQKHT
jgi:hypothetical protein